MLGTVLGTILGTLYVQPTYVRILVCNLYIDTCIHVNIILSLYHTHYIRYHSCIILINWMHISHASTTLYNSC